jgi:hypothetical protein
VAREIQFGSRGGGPRGAAEPNRFIHNGGQNPALFAPSRKTEAPGGVYLSICQFPRKISSF